MTSNGPCGGLSHRLSDAFAVRPVRVHQRGLPQWRLHSRVVARTTDWSPVAAATATTGICRGSSTRASSAPTARTRSFARFRREARRESRRRRGDRDRRAILPRPDFARCRRSRRLRAATARRCWSRSGRSWRRIASASPARRWRMVVARDPRGRARRRRSDRGRVRGAAGRHRLRQGAGADGVTALHANIPDNVCFDFEYGDAAKTAELIDAGRACGARRAGKPARCADPDGAARRARLVRRRVATPSSCAARTRAPLRCATRSRS